MFTNVAVYSNDFVTFHNTDLDSGMEVDLLCEGLVVEGGSVRILSPVFLLTFPSKEKGPVAAPVQTEAPMAGELWARIGPGIPPAELKSSTKACNRHRERSIYDRA